MILATDLKVGDVIYVSWTGSFERVTGIKDTGLEELLEIKTTAYFGILHAFRDQYLEEVDDHYP